MTVQCPICGCEPVRSLTSANNAVLRCDGDASKAVPRHTVYVIAATMADAEAIWAATPDAPC